MYILAREFFGEFPAIIAALLYTYAPYHAQEVYVRGSLSEFWASVFFPFILWSIYKRKFVLTAISIAGLFLTHNILSFLFIPVILFWTTYFLYIQKTVSWKKIVLSGLLGIGLSSFFVLPMLFERGYVHVETLLGGYFDYRQHFVTIRELFLSNNWGYGSSALGPIDDLSLSTGILHWILGLTAIGIAFLKFKKDKKISLLILGLGVIALTTLFLTHEKSSFIWSLIPALSWLQFPWRFLSLSVFVLAFLSGYAVSKFGKAKYIFGIIIIGLIFVLHLNFFAPKSWLNVNDNDELTGAMWEKELTASIFDYLPIYAKFPPNSKAPDFPEILDGKAVFADYIKRTRFQEGSVNVSENATVRIPLYDFPGMEVKIDGKKINHINNDCRNQEFCLGLISFTIPKGDHIVKIFLNDTPIRRFGNILTLISLATVLYLVSGKYEIYKK
jgi:hypothetical protein